MLGVGRLRREEGNTPFPGQSQAPWSGCRDAYAAVALCGFVDLSHLNRHFKRISGVTASEFARM